MQATEKGEMKPEKWESIQKACHADISFEEFKQTSANAIEIYHEIFYLKY